MRLAFLSTCVLVAATLGCGAAFDADGSGGGSSSSGQGGAATGTGTGTAGSGGSGGSTTGTPTGTGAAGAGGSGGAPAGAGGGVGGGSAPPPCDSLFSDSFDDLDGWTKVNGGGGDTDINNNAAVASPSNGFALIYTNQAYPLTICGAQVHVVQSNASGSYTWLGASVDNGGMDRLELAIVNGELQAFYVEADTPTLLANAPFNAASQSWLRIRRVAPDVRFETAPAAAGPWTTFHVEPEPSFINANFNFTLGVTNVCSMATGTFDDFDARTPDP